MEASLSNKLPSPGFDACMEEMRKANATLDRIQFNLRGIRKDILLVKASGVMAIAFGVVAVSLLLLII